ncbi:MAG: hypothetical protein JWN82_160 [Candidatus Saccharibacteria bacterium]|nr:hypothetical protein [Candidatus Saccharibacteria bacterium]
MIQKINISQLLQNRRVYAVLALQLVAAIVLTALPMNKAEAVQIQARNIQMSDSAPSGGSITTGVGSGTKVIYKVSFTTTNTASTIGGIVIDFCSNSPLAGETCTAPTGLLTNKSTTAIFNASGMGTGAFAVYTSDAGTANASRLILTRASPAALTSTVSFELGNATNALTNPSTTGTFFARIYTYATAAAAQGHVTSAATGYIDYGGIALSTVSVITITARVQENLAFCLSNASPTSNCGGASTPAVTLGHGTTTQAIDSSTVDTANVYSQISTNAGSGAVVRIRNSNSSCGGLSLDGGTTCGIPPAFSGANTTPVAAMPAGTAAFGLMIGTAAGTTIAAPYNAVTTNYFGMDTASTNNVTTTYGSQALSCSGPVSNVNNTWTFGATASNTTPSGVYTANIVAIATGTF